jgi:hypothetical protein
MKRRSFLATIAGIIAAPFVAKKAIAETPAAKPYTVAVDFARDSVPDRHSVTLMEVGSDGAKRVMSHRKGIFDEQNEALDLWHNRAKWEITRQAKWQFGPGSRPSFPHLSEVTKWKGPKA